jgi:putative nucleotidyltransferase with HDIG domain
MHYTDLQSLKTLFAEYCASFFTPVAEDQRNIALKQEHTREVCLNAVLIAKDLGLTDEEALLAETVALFHDIGRFSQYQQFKTYNDSVSINHAALGAKVLLENNMLRGLSKRDRDIIVRAVTLHNVFAVPDQLDADTLLFLKLVRDADKLDIWRVFIDYYSRRYDEGRATAVALGLPDSPDYSQQVVSRLLTRHMVKIVELKTLNDFKLLQLSWIYDLNFSCSLRLVKERDYVTRLAETLPKADDIDQAVEAVRTYINGGLRRR